MIEVLFDSNILLNVWGREADPRRGVPLWEASAKALSAAGTDRVKGHVCLINVFELLHHFRVRAVEAGSDPKKEMDLVLQKIADLSLKQIIPDSTALTVALSLILSCHLDPSARGRTSVPIRGICGWEMLFCH